jgi:AmpD protein
LHPYFAEIRQMQVSAHLLLRRDGELLQFVNLRDRAWHAGQSAFQGRDNCNDFSIGIELEGGDDDPYTDQQYDNLGAVTAALLAHYPMLEPTRIVGHSDIAPGRKTDPGPAFDWRRYRHTLVSTGD